MTIFDVNVAPGIGNRNQQLIRSWWCPYCWIRNQVHPDTLSGNAIIGKNKAYVQIAWLTKSSFYWERDLYVRNGKCFGVYELGKPVLYLSDPELIREVLVKDFHIFNNRR
ncbi:unnamed protein product, partial [Oppiella nova]